MNAPPAGSASVRLLTDAELVDGSRLAATGMLGNIDDVSVAGWADTFEAERSHGAFDSEGTLVGMARWFATRLSIPGGDVPAAGVTAVAVLPTHRRQGHLSRLMRAQLDAIRAEQIPVAVLIAAEWPIYGRFGYGPAVDACGWKLDAAAARFREAATGRVELCTPAELLPHLERVHDLRWARTPGAVTRAPHTWERAAGVSGWPGHPFEPGKYRSATWRDAAGEVLGALSYSVEEAWAHNRPNGTAEVRLLVGATPEAERELWRHLCDLDWITAISAGGRGIDDPLPNFLLDARMATQVDRSDCIWARILDLPAAFAPRRSTMAGQVTVEVDDDLGYAAGTWSITLGPESSEVAATSASAEVRLSIGALGAAYLGGASLTRLHEAGQLTELQAGAVARLDALLRTTTAPWSPTTY